MKQLYMLIALIAILCVAAFSIYKKINNATSGKKPEELLQILVSHLKQNFIPFITDIAVRDKMENIANYDDFKKICKELFTKEIYIYITENQKTIFDYIPDYLEPYITESLVETFVDRIIRLDEVNEILEKAYDKHLNNAIEKTKKNDEEYDNLIKEIAPDGDDGAELNKVEETLEASPDLPAVDVFENLPDKDMIKNE